MPNIMSAESMIDQQTAARNEFDRAAAGLGAEGRLIVSTAAARRRPLLSTGDAAVQSGPFEGVVIIPGAGAAVNTDIDLLALDPAARTGPLSSNFWPGNTAPNAANRPSFVFFIDAVSLRFDEGQSFSQAQYDALTTGLSLFQQVQLSDRTISDGTGMQSIGTYSDVTAIAVDGGGPVAFERRCRRTRVVALNQTIPVWGGPGGSATPPQGNTLSLRVNAGGIPALPAAGVRISYTLYGVAVQQSNNPTQLQSLYMGGDNKDSIATKAIQRLIRAERILRLVSGGI